MDNEYTNEDVQAPMNDSLVIGNTVYDKMKSFVQLVGPAFITFYLFAGNALNWPNVETYAGIGTAALTFLGIVVTWLSASFQKSDARFDGVIHVSEDDDGLKKASLVLKNYENPADVVNQDVVTFRVRSGK